MADDDINVQYKDIINQIAKENKALQIIEQSLETVAKSNKTEKSKAVSINVGNVKKKAAIERLDKLKEEKLSLEQKEARYIGPYTVARVAQNGSYVLRDAEGDVADHTVPIDQLKVANFVMTI